MRRLALCACLILTFAGPVRAQGFAGVEAAMAASDWDIALVLAADLPEARVAETLVTWTRLREGDGSFPDYAAFLTAHPDWPALDQIRARGEPLIVPETPPDAVLAYFDGAAPQTGTGVVRLVAALDALGRDAEAEAALRDAWLTLGLDDDGFAALLLTHAADLSPLHAARADALLWRGRTTDAARLLPLLPDDRRLLAEARIALITNAGDRAARVAAVPAALADDPGLAYDRFDRLARAGDYADATALLTARTASADLLGQPFRWASWRAALARWAMREGRPEEAYALASQHHLSGADATTEAYADLEWLAGYIALTYLNTPERALEHFGRVEAIATAPISRARAGYWMGRAHERLGETAQAEAAFARAAAHQTAFYGLLAAERLGLPLDPVLAGTEAFPDWRTADWRGTEIARAIDLLLDGGSRVDAVRFVAALAQTLDRTGVAQLGLMMADRDEPFFAVLVGKTATAREMVLPAIYFPLHPMARTNLPVAPELALSIARRESEFNFAIGSPVGALGLMQLMPGTAEEVSRQLGLPYSRAQLTSEWQYNAMLGSRYLATLTERFGDSPVMIAAGYNAGPSRPGTWMAQRGDPRRGEVDVVDWIEHIPFTETRNYVMRVTESIPVYRARLGAPSGPIGFTALLNGNPPFRRPFSREDAAARATDTRPESRPDIEPAAQAGPSGPATLRPLARPGG